MPWILLNSNSLHAAQYLDQERLLDLEFCDGSAYRYFHVPASTWEALLRAESHGWYFNHQIRKRFHSVKIQLAKPACVSDRTQVKEPVSP